MSESDDLVSDQIASPTDEVQTSPVAEMLVRARQEKNLSQQDVADKLFLTVSYIKHIDEGRFDKIPKPAFTRGYLRSYARIVGVSGDDVVNCYDAANGRTEFEAASLRNVTEKEMGAARFTGPVAQTGFIGLVGIGLLIFLVSWLVPPDDQSSEDSTQPVQQIAGRSAEPASAAAVESIPGVIDAATIDEPAGVAAQPSESSPDNSTPPIVADDSTEAQPLETAVDGAGTPASAGEDDEQMVQIQDDSRDESSVVTEPLDVEGDESNAAESAREVSIERSQEGEFRVVSVLADGEDHLRFNFVDECWLEVADAEEYVVYADLNHASDIVDIYGQAPFKILIGRAQSVTLFFNDQPYSLVPHISNDTAKLVLGD